MKLSPYATTDKLASYWGVGTDFFYRRKKSGEFVKNVHYVQRDNTIVWNTAKIHEWWHGENVVNEFAENMLNKLLG